MKVSSTHAPSDSQAGVMPTLPTVHSGSLPVGMALNSIEGELTGIPTSYGLHTFTIRMEDSSGATAATAPTLPSGVVTFLLTDIEGSTALWDTDPDRVVRTICASAGDEITPSEWEKHVPGAAYRPICAN